MLILACFYQYVIERYVPPFQLVGGCFGNFQKRFAGGVGKISKLILRLTIEMDIEFFYMRMVIVKSTVSRKTSLSFLSIPMY